MTRARALKQIIRARAAKTGERYTTARRHVLKEVPPQPAAADSTQPEVRPQATRFISDDTFRKKTGHSLDYWFDVLDRFGGVEKGHTLSARHLYEEHDVEGWYAQGITVAYERARGVRVANQRCDGEYEVSVSKVIPATASQVIEALTVPGVRKRWVVGLDPHLVGALTRALDGPASKGIIVRADGLGRFRYKWDDTTVQLYLLPKGEGKVSLVATNSKLASAHVVEERRTKWRAALSALAGLYAAPGPGRRRTRAGA
jgi:hypothetical protein